ncbi:MAG: hypothetical protein Q4E43_06715, partial [Akkermansia sp.]|nr:hypothetical protein [Akkermansia sp.]
RQAAETGQARPRAAATPPHNEREARCYPRSALMTPHNNMTHKYKFPPSLLHCAPLSSKKPKFSQILRVMGVIYMHSGFKIRYTYMRG